jgi:N12 class adenine-specific DNA methylase
MSMDDIDSILDEEESGPKQTAPKPPKTTTTSKPVGGPRTAPSGTSTKKSASDIVSSAATHGVKGINESIKGLYELFGGSALKSFPGGVDEDTYAKAKPHFENALAEFQAAGKDIRDFVRWAYDSFSTKIKPYLRYFIMEKKGIAPEKEPETEPPTGEKIEIEEAGEEKPKPPKKPKKEKLKDVGEALGGKRSSKDHTTRSEAIEIELDGGIDKDADPEKFVDAVIKLTTKSNILKIDHGVEGRTPGTIRFLSAFRQQINTWLVEQGKRWGGSTSKWRPSYRDAIVDRVRDSDKSQKEIKKTASKYISALEQINEAVKGVATITDARAAIMGVLYKEESIWAWGNDIEKFKEAVDRWDVLSHYEHSSDVAQELFYYVRQRPQVYSLLTTRFDKMLEEENEADKDQLIIRAGVGIFKIETPDDIRKGKDMKGEDLMSTFGLRGVDYGEWAEADFRQRSVNLTYDSFKMLAELLGAPDIGISINDEMRLGIGYGARGRGGNTAAAFWPTNRVIGLTKTKGDGSLAHEWSHAFDHMAKPENMKVEYDGIKYNAISDLKQALRYFYKTDDLQETVELILRGLRLNSGLRSKRLDDAKKFLKEEWEREIIKQTEFHENAVGLDKGVNGEYWSKPEEEWARAFEAWVADKLQGENLYLVDADFVSPGEVESRFNRRFGAYPTEAERERFNSIFDHFFDSVEWSNDGIPKLKKDYQPVTLYERDQAKKAIDKMLDRVDELYEELYRGSPSPDGMYWYGYEQTSRGAMMQPKGYVGYDDKLKMVSEDPENAYNGTGAVAYPDPLSADDVIKFGIIPLQYEKTDDTIYLEGPEDGTTNEVGEAGADSLVEASPDDVQTTPREEATETGPISGPRESEGLTDGLSIEAGNTSRPGVGDSDVEVDTSPGREGDTDSDGGPDAIGPVDDLDYSITATDELNTRNTTERFNNNIAALRVLKEIEGENRKATLEEQRILVKYNGWGELGNALEPVAWANKQWKGRAEIVREVLTEEEINEVRPSVQNAYYTPPGVVNQIYSALMKFGFKGGRILEPSVGAGHFFGMMPEEMRRGSTLTGIDKDPMSARIAAQLYQSASIHNNTFEDSSLPDNFYDLSISNVPFGDVRIHDRKHNPLNFVIHDFFINKMINVTKPGGMVAVITSTGTMDKADVSARNAWAQKVDFVGAIRLPNGIYAGAQAGSDVIFLRKKADNAPSLKPIQWENTESVEMDEVDSSGNSIGWKAKKPINEYFIKNKEMVLGTFAFRSGWHGGVQVIGNTEKIETNMEKAIDRLQANIYTEDSTPDVVDIANSLPGSGVIKDGQYYIGKDGVYINTVGSPEKVKFRSKEAENVVRSLIGIRGVARDLLLFQAQKKTASQIKKLRLSLNKKYDAFVKANGPINLPKNYRLISDDPDAGLLSALENWDPSTQRVTSKAAIFTQNTIADINPPDHADTSEDALVYSLAWRGRVDLNYMGGLTGKTTGTLINELSDKIYDDPEKGYVTSDEYLSGNVRKKLIIAEAAAKQDKKYQVNVDMLKAALPKDLEPHEIRAKLGSGWVPSGYIKTFVDQLFSYQIDGLKIDYVGVTGKWTVSWSGVSAAQGKRNKDRAVAMVQSTTEFGTKRVNFFDNRRQTGILSYALNGGFPEVWDEFRDSDGDIVRVKNEVETDAASNKVAQLQERFSRWAWEDSRRAEQLQKIYNETFNSYVDRVYNGDHLTFPGKVPDEIIKLRDHQKAAVWRYLQTGTAYLAHEVGTGKTYTMIASIMEARRLGLCKKPILNVMKTSMEQIRSDFLKLYPGANILTLHVSSNKRKRKAAMNRIATGNWDAVIVNHHSFQKIPLSAEAEIEFINDEKRKLRAAMEAARMSRAARYTIKDIENRLSKLEQRLRKARDRKKDDIPTMEEMGIDMIVVDEAHTHKNISFSSVHGNVKGVQTLGSKIADDLYFKTQYIHRRFGRGLLFASGTPLTNSVGELFNISRYLQPQVLDRLHVNTFDAWANTFGIIRQEAEYAPSGGGFKMTSRFAEFVNIPELMSFVRQAMDIKRAQELNINRPDVVGGKPKAVKVEQSNYATAFQETIKWRVQNYRVNGKEAEWNGKNDNMLRIVNDGRLVAMDPRLFDASAADEENTKTNVAVDKIFEIYNSEQPAKDDDGKAYQEKKHLQLIFLDRGVPGRGFNLYRDIKKKLVEKGVKESEIAFIHDATTKQKKILMFRNANDGKIRILIGSTKKMGIGVNIQKRVSAMHHLDVDWTYANYEQRNGRGWRYGNRIDTVQIYNYGTVKTVDAFMWSTVSYKEKILGQVLSNDPKIRHVEDISKTSMEASEMEALLSDDPLHKEKIELESDLRKLRNIQTDFEHGRRRAQKRLNSLPFLIKAAERSKANNETHLEIAKRLTAIEFPGRKGGKFFDIKKEGGSVNKAMEMSFSRYNNPSKLLSVARLGTIVTETVPTLEIKKSPKTGKEWEVHGEKEVKRFKEDDGSIAILYRVASFGEEKHRDKTGFIKALEYRVGPDLKYEYLLGNGVSRGLTNIITGLENNIVEGEKKIKALDTERPELEKTVAKKFDRQQELIDKEVRLNEVTSELLRQQQEADAQVRNNQDLTTQPDTKKFYAYGYGDGERKTKKPYYYEVDGEAVDVGEGVEAFVYYVEGAEVWSVTEANSGMRMASAPERILAIEKAKEGIERVGIDSLNEQVAAAVKEHGAAPGSSRTINIIDTLAGDTGSSQLATDIYNYANELVQSGLTSYRQFRAKIKKRFADVYEKIKQHLKIMWNTLNNERGELNLKGIFETDLPDNATIEKSIDMGKGINKGERYTKPPAWLAKQYSEFKELYDRQKQRVKDRMRYLARTMKEADKFFSLKGDALKEMNSLIFATENVLPGKMGIKARKFLKEDDQYVLNDKYYEEYKAFLDKTSVSDEVKEAFLDLRRTLDKDLATVINTMSEMKDIDDAVLEEMRKSMGQIHNYFPHMRYGKYYIQAINNKTGEVVYREHFDAKTGYTRKAKRLIRENEPELKKENQDISWKIGQVEKIPEDVFAIPIPIEAIEAVMNAAIDRMPDADAKNAFRKMLPQAVSDALKSRGWGSHMIKRKNIPGYETEKTQKVLFDYKAGLYGWITKMETARDFSLSMSKVDSKKKPNLWAAMRQYSYDMLANSDHIDTVVDGLRAIFFAKYLGLNVKTAVLNTTQNIIAGWPRLSMETSNSFGKVMRGAASDIVAYITKKKNLTEDEAKLLSELYEEGITNSNFLNEVRGKLGTDASTVFNRTLKIMGLPMEIAERFNRCSLALAAYRAARDGQVKRFNKNKVSYGAAKAFAEEIVEDAHFVYGKTNRPEAFRGSVGKVVSLGYTFRTFTHNLVNLWSWMLRNGGYGAVMRSVAGTIAIGGLSSIPLYKTLMHLVRQLYGDEPEDEILPDTPGLLRDMLLYGLPAGAGVSLGGSIGMELPIFDKVRLDQSITQQLWNNFNEIVGIPGAVIEDIEGAARAAAAGQGARALEYILPTALANPIKAVRLHTVGQTSMSGKPINLPGESGPRKISFTEALGKVAGFQPVSSTKSYDLYRKIEDYKSFKQGKQKEFANRIMNAVRNGNDKARLDAVGDLVAWNKKQFEKKRFEYIITGEDINRSLKSRLKAGQPPTYLLPKAIKLRNKNFPKEN